MSQNGKGSRPRSNFSRQFRQNFDRINWKSREDQDLEKNERKYKYVGPDGLVTAYALVELFSGKMHRDAKRKAKKK